MTALATAVAVGHYATCQLCGERFSGGVGPIVALVDHHASRHVRCPECGSILVNRRCPRCDR